MNRVLFYLFALGIFAAAIFGITQLGRKLPAPEISAANPGLPATTAPLSSPPPADSLVANLRENLQDPLARLFIQMILIVLIARLFGMMAAKIRQPAVIGEMIAGILLGPSLLGWLAPEIFQFVFPSASLGTLRLLSQIGVCLFMFVIGMELDLSVLKHQARTALLVSQMSILVPYLLGVGTAFFLYSTLAGPHTTFLTFALFIGISMSITAFPVLARILEERGLTKTPLGSTAIACAATDDVTAWSILAFVVAIAKARSVAATVLNLGLVILFVLVMLYWIKPRLARWFSVDGRENAFFGRSVIAGVLIFVFTSALATDLMGIHALFGAFLAGVVMPPQHEFREFLKLRLENFSSIFLLPLFFAFTGLRTQIGLLDDSGSWLLCGGLVLIATIGKLGGAMLTARFTGVSWGDSFALGALMNTRGLVELIALNVGYDLGILSPRIFTMLVIMALATTFMTGPLLTFGEWLRRRKSLEPQTA